jgi:hypothetical protein
MHPALDTLLNGDNNPRWERQEGQRRESCRAGHDAPEERPGYRKEGGNPKRHGDPPKLLTCVAFWAAVANEERREGRGQAGDHQDDAGGARDRPVSA